MIKNKIISITSIMITVLPFYGYASNQIPPVTCQIGDQQEQLRNGISEDEDFPFKYSNPFSLEGCDLEFDFPGFSFDLGVSGVDFCSIAKRVTKGARDNWNKAVEENSEWMDNTIDASAEDGVTVNGEQVTGGLDNNVGGDRIIDERININ